MMKTLLTMLMCVVGCSLFAHPISIRGVSVDGDSTDRTINVGRPYMPRQDFTLRFTLDVPVGTTIPQGNSNVFALFKGANYASRDYGGTFINSGADASRFDVAHHLLNWIGSANTLVIEADKSYVFTVRYTGATKTLVTETTIVGEEGGETYAINPLVWGDVSENFTIRLGQFHEVSIPGAVYRDITFETSLLGTIPSSRKWSDIRWTDGVKPMTADDPVVLLWDDEATSEALTLDFDQAVTSGTVTFNTTKPLTLTKTTAEVLSIVSYGFPSAETPLTFGAGYTELPNNCLGTNITLTMPQTGEVKSALDKTVTYTGGTTSGSKPNFAPIYGGTVNLTGGAYSFNEILGSGTPTQLMIGGVDKEHPVTVGVDEIFRLGTMTATINEFAMITTHALHIPDQIHDGPGAMLIQNGGTLRVTGNYTADNANADIMIGRWRSPATYTLNGGTFEAPNAAITMGFDGGSRKYLLDIAGGTVKAKGFRLQTAGSSASTRNTLKIRNGGTFEVGDLGINANGRVLDFSMDGGTLAASADYTSNAPLGVEAGGAIVETATYTRNEDGTIDTAIPPTPRTVTFNGAVSGEGTLTQRGTGTLVWENASLPQTLTVESGGTLDITTSTLVMQGMGQSITGAVGAINLPDSLVIDLKGRFDITPQGSVTLMTGVTSFEGKAITFVNTPAIPLQEGNQLSATLSSTSFVTWGANTTSGTWVNGDVAPSPWMGDAMFADGDSVFFGVVVDASAATVTMEGMLAPSNVNFNGGSTMYTLTGEAGNTVVVNGYFSVNSGTVNWDAPFEVTGAFSVSPEATFSINAAKGFLFPVDFANNGTFVIDAPTGLTLPNVFTNDGFIVIRSGIVTSHADQKPAGAFQIDTGATLVVTAGVASSTLTTITGAGTLRILQKARDLQGSGVLNFNLSNFDGQVEVVKGGAETTRIFPDCFTYVAADDQTPSKKPTFSFGEGTQLYQNTSNWGFDVTIRGDGFIEDSRLTFGVIRNDYALSGHITLAGDATISSRNTFEKTITSTLSLPPTLTIGGTHDNGNTEANMTISGNVAQTGTPISLLVRHHTTTLSGTGTYETLGITTDAQPSAKLVINGTTKVKKLALSKGTITLGASGTLTLPVSDPPAVAPSSITIDIGDRVFEEGATILDWSAATTKPDVNATFELVQTGGHWYGLTKTDTGLTIAVDKITILGGTISNEVKRYVNDIASGPITMTKQQADAIYLFQLAELPTGTLGFKVSDMDVVSAGETTTVTVKAKLTVSEGTVAFDTTLTPTLTCNLEGSTDVGKTWAPVGSALATFTSLDSIATITVSVENNPTAPTFYKVIVVETPDTPAK